MALTLLTAPLLALIIRVPWTQLPELLASETALMALRLSMICATAAWALSLLLGLPLAYVLARSQFRGLAFVRAVVALPLVLPPVVGGVALLSAFGRQGVLGAPLYQLTGITLPFSTAAVVLAETFVALPFFVVTMEAAFRGLDGDHEEAARSLGANRWHALRTVTLPMLAPSVAAASVLAWARALGEFGATVTFAGNFPGTTQTMPLAVYLAMESDPAAATALSLVLLAICLIVLTLLRGRWS